jgi:hypothetical protein
MPKVAAADTVAVDMAVDRALPARAARAVQAVVPVPGQAGVSVAVVAVEEAAITIIKIKIPKTPIHTLIRLQIQAIMEEGPRIKSQGLD